MMSRLESLLKRYFELRNRQIELMERASAEFDAALNLGEQVQQAADALEEKIPVLNELSEALSELGVNPIDSDEIAELDPKLWKPDRVAQAVPKVWKFVGLPSPEEMRKLDIELRQYLELRNEQLSRAKAYAQLRDEAAGLTEGQLADTIAQLEDLPDDPDGGTWAVEFLLESEDGALWYTEDVVEGITQEDVAVPAPLEPREGVRRVMKRVEEYRALEEDEEG